MTETSKEQDKRIISTLLHQIDVDSKACTLIPISSDYSDLEGYLSDLLAEISEKPQKREYEFVRETTEFHKCLETCYLQQDLATNKAASNIATRLLDKETDADNRYGHLSATGSGHVKKGSFLQFLYRDGTAISYLGVKIEHQAFLDESDFKKKVGLALVRKIYKACKASFESTGRPHSVFIYDTNPKPSTYWWKDFLELKEVRNDAVNTKTASQEVVKVLNTLRRDHPADYTILRNAAIAAFKQQGEMKYDEFITNTFESYHPEDNKLAEKLPELIIKLRKLPEKKNFDTRFNLVPGEVPFKHSKVALTKEISLTMDEGIENLDDKVWSEKSPSGKKLVVIDSPIGFDQFKLKERA